MGHGHPWGERRCHLSRPAGQTDGSGRGRGRYFSSLGLTTCSALLVRLNLARVSSSPDPPAASPPSLSPSIVPSHSVTDAFLPPCFPAVSAASPPLSLSLWFAPFSLGGPLPLSCDLSSCACGSVECARLGVAQAVCRVACAISHEHDSGIFQFGLCAAIWTLSRPQQPQPSARSCST